MERIIKEFIQRYKNFCENIRETQDYDSWWMTDEEADESVTYGNQCYELPVIRGSKWVGDFKVKFDMENYGHVGLGMTSGGTPYLVSWYGGDWEEPLVVFYYFDDEGGLRNYIPTKGNTYNPITKTAFGSEEYASDIKNLCIRYGCKDSEGLRILGFKELGYSVQSDLFPQLSWNWDLDACSEEFESYIQIHG